MKENKEFFKKTYNISRYLFLYLFVAGVVSVIVYGFSGYFIPLLNAFSANSLLYGEALYQEAVTAGELTAEEGMYFVYGAIYAAILELIPFLLAFIFSKKSYGWMKIGFFLYAIDTFVAVMLLIANVGGSSASPWFFILLLILHIPVLGALGFALYAGSKFFPKRIYGYGGPHQCYGNGAFATVRTLCLTYDVNTYENADFTYYINGSQQGTLSFGQTRIILLDGNYQRIVLTAPGCISCETVVSAGTCDVTYTVGVVFNDKGERVISVLPLTD